MKYLFDCWNDFLELFYKARVVCMFFDYDGTLTPIVNKPELAILPLQTKKLLSRLAKKRWSRLAIVSGRSLKNVKKLVGLKKVIYAGNHGLELQGPRIKFTNKKAVAIRKCLDVIYDSLVDELKGNPRILIEHKGLTLSVHYRLEKNKNKINKVFKTVEQLTLSYVRKKALRISHGKKVIEIKPRIDWNKGKVVLWLLKYFKQNKNSLSIYLGDDTTDEDAFRVLRNKGIGIFIGDPSKKKTQAKFYLRNTRQVADFLSKIVYKN
ncbi:MAG: trehalose-phosphatase [Candidatus Omnitrophota bacterium]